MMRNHPEFVETMIAASITGAVFVPIDPRTRGDKLAFMLRQRRAAAAWSAADYCLRRGRPRRAGSAPGVELGAGARHRREPDAVPIDEVEGVEPLAAVLDTPAAHRRRAPRRPPTDPLQIIYTSGTTGDPEGRGVHQRPLRRRSRMLGLLFGYQRRRPALHRAVAHPRQRPGGHAGAVAGHGPAGRLQPPVHQVQAVGRLPGPRLHHLLAARWAWPPRSTASRRGPTTPTTRCASVVSAGMPAAIWEAFEQRFGVRDPRVVRRGRGRRLAFKPVGRGSDRVVRQADPRSRDEGSSTSTTSSARRAWSARSARARRAARPRSSTTRTRRPPRRRPAAAGCAAATWATPTPTAGSSSTTARAAGLRHNGDFVNPGFVEKVHRRAPAGRATCSSTGCRRPRARRARRTWWPPSWSRAGRRASTPASVFAHCRGGAGVELRADATCRWWTEIPKTASEKPQERFLLDAFEPDRVAGRVMTAS